MRLIVGVTDCRCYDYSPSRLEGTTGNIIRYPWSVSSTGGTTQLASFTPNRGTKEIESPDNVIAEVDRRARN